MIKLVDRYTFIARVAPVAIIGLAVPLAIGAWIPFTEWPIKLIGGSTMVTIGAFAASCLARDAGQAIQGPLWASWGGPPTVQLLRHRDGTIAVGSKALLHKHLVALGIVDSLPTPAEEASDPEGADANYLTCADWLRRKALELKAKAPFDVVHDENVAYGFRRNLLGIRPYGLALVGVALIAAVAAFPSGRNPYSEVAGIVALGLSLVFSITPGAVRQSAFDYSKRLLDAAQSLQAPKATGPRRRAGPKPVTAGT